MHGLTHRAVERVTALPAGTASNYFRSRHDLLVSAAERIVALHLADMERIDRETDVSDSYDPMVDLIAASIADAVTTSRERYLAIFELQLEARRRPTLRAAMAELAQRSVAFIAVEHAKLGLALPPEAAPTLMAFYAGALLTMVAGDGEPDQEAIRRLAAAMVNSVRVDGSR